jgi:hypothetical protein
MLRDALLSVRRQTARSAIARIVVSENSLSEGSKAVCGEFADLPVVYVQQRPPVPPLLHLKAIWGLVESPLVAILHDDDWWAPGHLASALATLESNERCVASYSSFLESLGPRSYAWFNHCVYLVWLAAGADFSQPTLLLDPPGVMLACLFNASLHYSTVVGRTEAMWDAYTQNVARGNAFDNDRTFPVFLSRHGSVGYVTGPDVFVRQHPFRTAWTAEYLKQGHMNMAQETTRWLLKHHPREVALAAAKFKQVAGELNSREAEAISGMLRTCVGEPQWTTLIEECGVELNAISAKLPRGLLPRWIVSSMVAVCPPVLWRLAMRIRMWGGWEQHIRRWQAEERPAKQESPDASGEAVVEKTASGA